MWTCGAGSGVVRVGVGLRSRVLGRRVGSKADRNAGAVGLSGHDAALLEREAKDLTKRLLERGLGGEFTEHLGYEHSRVFTPSDGFGDAWGSCGKVW